MLTHIRRLLTDALPLETQVLLLSQLPSLDSITPAELALCVKEVLSQAIRIPYHGARLVDIVGTGGDRKNTFNVSTTASFVVAASGVSVAKHGNRAVTSRSGGFDLLQALNVDIPEAPAEAMAQLTEHGLTFLFAPFFNPVFARLREARAVLATQGKKTVFNLLGPLVNPAPLKRIAMGVFDPGFISLCAHTLLLLGYEKAFVFHGNGMDELSLMGSDTMAVLDNGRIHVEQLNPENLGLMQAVENDFAGGDAVFNAEITRAILQGENVGVQRDIVLLNAAAAIAAGTEKSLVDALEMARASLDSGRAFLLLQSLRKKT